MSFMKNQLFLEYFWIFLRFFFWMEGVGGFFAVLVRVSHSIFGQKSISFPPTVKKHPFCEYFFLPYII